MPVDPPFISTEKITVESPLLKLTGVALMLVRTLAACWMLVSREIRFEPSRASLVTTCWSSSANDVSMTPSVIKIISGMTIANSTMLWPRSE